MIERPFTTFPRSLLLHPIKCTSSTELRRTSYLQVSGIYPVLTTKCVMLTLSDKDIKAYIKKASLLTVFPFTITNHDYGQAPRWVSECIARRLRCS